MENVVLKWPITKMGFNEISGVPRSAKVLTTGVQDGNLFLYTLSYSKTLEDLIEDGVQLLRVLVVYTGQTFDHGHNYTHLGTHKIGSLMYHVFKIN